MFKSAFPTMFLKFTTLATVSLVTFAAATPTTVARGLIPPSECNVGDLQCCNTITKGKDPAAAGILALLGVVLQDVNVDVGLTCSPITVIGGGGGSCNANPVCCENNSLVKIVSGQDSEPLGISLTMSSHSIPILKTIPSVVSLEDKERLDSASDDPASSVLLHEEFIEKYGLHPYFQFSGSHTEEYVRNLAIDTNHIEGTFLLSRNSVQELVRDGIDDGLIECTNDSALKESETIRSILKDTVAVYR
uniref:Hydrophobin n=1 Tax=Flammulina velutipes TaxID=38945 RepID=G8A517_FLAVE|nr:putative hydrophobin 2 [Flammulina velutipes]